MTTLVQSVLVDVPADDFADTAVQVSSMVVGVPVDGFGPSMVESLYPSATLYPSEDLYPAGPPS
ncbi:hypothetical protein SEA_JABBERWOCKY_37 [Gordonia phage Jabberwocky]|uniref:Uncharacterized protein n=1 Tax=Gordonia phage Jabberwocky TaxID=2653273 RepID=A0A5P8D6L5_9CAUD|nr:hypothetical protein KNU76_gp37 [Gordonia phage Jabberwocky]QFP94092.1 hypothetical protein SEA_JABBERWOCKY_37 [Gordonia phage Jabberwocky]